MHTGDPAEIGASGNRLGRCSPGPQGSDASRYVRIEDGGFIDVFDVDPSDRYARGPYTCLACGHLMVPALGRTRRHHFKHKAGRPADCNNETYLHQLAKMVLFSALSEAIRTGRPYWFTRTRPAICSHYEESFGFSCTRRQAPFATDLAATFDRVDMEAGADGFVGDILLSSSRSGERILVEIAVTHLCDARKTSSGLPIIELDIRTEDAASRLKEGIDATTPGARCHNLPEPDPAPHLCTTPCAATGLALLLYEGGKAWYSELDLENWEEILSDPRLLAHEIVDARPGHHARGWREIREHFRDFMIRHAFENGKSVRSCLLCRNNGGRLNDHDIYCDARDGGVWMSSSALGCRFYDPAADGAEAARIFDGKMR